MTPNLSLATQSPADRGTPSPQRMALDNLIRRELRVGDPNDAKQIAKALQERYQGEARTRALDQEAQGLPFLQAQPMFVPAAMERTATAIDLEQAKKHRAAFGFFRDRRPVLYARMAQDL